MLGDEGLEWSAEFKVKWGFDRTPSGDYSRDEGGNEIELSGTGFASLPSRQIN
jgi:hypothetical protein